MDFSREKNCRDYSQEGTDITKKRKVKGESAYL